MRSLNLKKLLRIFNKIKSVNKSMNNIMLTSIKDHNKVDNTMDNKIEAVIIDLSNILKYH